MGKCRFSRSKLGDQVTLNVDGTGNTFTCSGCEHTINIDGWSIQAWYEGHTIPGYDRFILLSESRFRCLGCGKLIYDWLIKCEQDGYWIELPVAVDLETKGTLR